MNSPSPHRIETQTTFVSIHVSILYHFDLRNIALKYHADVYMLVTSYIDSFLKVI